MYTFYVQCVFCYITFYKFKLCKLKKTEKIMLNVTLKIIHILHILYMYILRFFVVAVAVVFGIAFLPEPVAVAEVEVQQHYGQQRYGYCAEVFCCRALAPREIGVSERCHHYKVYQQHSRNQYCFFNFHYLRHL